MRASTQALVDAIHAADAAHDANVARRASPAELQASYTACLRAQLALCESEGENEAAQILRATIAKGAK